MLLSLRCFRLTFGVMVNCSQVLMLHGYRQNAATFQGKTGAFRKNIKKHCDLGSSDTSSCLFGWMLHSLCGRTVCDSAWERRRQPLHSPAHASYSYLSIERGWYFCKDEPIQHYHSTESTAEYIGLQETMDLLNKVCQCSRCADQQCFFIVSLYYVFLCRCSCEFQTTMFVVDFWATQRLRWDYRFQSGRSTAKHFVWLSTARQDGGLSEF